MTRKVASADPMGGTLIVLRPNGVEYERIRIAYLTRLDVDHAAGEASARIRNDRGWSPYFRLEADRPDGPIDVSAQWADVLGH